MANSDRESCHLKGSPKAKVKEQTALVFRSHRVLLDFLFNLSFRALFLNLNYFKMCGLTEELWESTHLNLDLEDQFVPSLYFKG